MNERAGTPARDQDLIDVDALISAYYDIEPDPADPLQAVVFGTSGHRGSSFDGAFNEAHIAATTQAIVEYRKAQGYDGPLFIGRDTHGLSAPAERTAIEVLVANDVDVRVDSRGSWTPTPSVSLAILRANGAGTAAGVDGGRDPGCSENLDGGAPGGLGQPVGVAAEVEGAVGALGAPVLDDRSGDRHDVGLVEGGVQGGAAVTRGAEDHLLGRDRGVGDEVVVGGDDLVDVDEVFGLCWLSCAWMHEGSVSLITGRVLRIPKVGRVILTGLSRPGVLRFFFTFQPAAVTRAVGGRLVRSAAVLLASGAVGRRLPAICLPGPAGSADPVDQPRQHVAPGGDPQLGASHPAPGHDQ